MPEQPASRWGSRLTAITRTYTVFPYAISTGGKCGLPLINTNHTGLISLAPLHRPGAARSTSSIRSRPRASLNVGASAPPLGGGRPRRLGTALIAATKIPTYLCPSDGGKQFFPGFDGNYGCALGLAILQGKLSLQHR